MKIGLVIHPYNEEKPAGLGRAIFSLAKKLIENDSDNQYTFFVKGENKKPDMHGSYNFVTLPSHVLWLDAGLKRNEEQDLYIFFTPFMPFFFRPKKSLVIAHDFGYISIKGKSIKEFIQKGIIAYIHRRSLQKATRIVAITEYTKKEIQRLFPVKEEKIVVIHNGFEPVCGGESVVKKRETYFLFMGVIKERKNVLALAQAYKIFYEKKSDKESIPNLVIAGKGSGLYYEKIVSFIKENNLQDKVILKGYVADGEVEHLFKNALAFVFPSLVEGFGLPVLEAMQCGVPVITSRGGALEEVVGGAAILVDPKNKKEIAEGFDRIYRDRDLREKFIEKGRHRVKEFSWDTAVDRYKNLIKDI